MREFSDLLDRLLLSHSRNRKIELLCFYFGATKDPDRGLALAALTRELDLPGVKPALFRQLASEVCDEELFRLSYDFVGDLAETVSLIWPREDENSQKAEKMSLGEIVDILSKTSRSEAPKTLRGMLDIMTPDERYALIKLVTGGLRIGVSSRLAKQALAEYGKVDVGEIEEIWHGLTPPYQELFAWLDGKAQKPVSLAAAPFRPVMLSHALEERDHPEGYRSGIPISPNGSGTAFACRRSVSAEPRGFFRAPAMISPARFQTLLAQWILRAQSTANYWWAQPMAGKMPLQASRIYKSA